MLAIYTMIGHTSIKMTIEIFFLVHKLINYVDRRPGSICSAKFTVKNSYFLCNGYKRKYKIKN